MTWISIWKERTVKLFYYFFIQVGALVKWLHAKCPDGGTKIYLIKICARPKANEFIP
jgi:hypothetical protein